MNLNEDTLRAALRGRGLHQPSQPGEVADADLSEGVVVP